MAPSSLPDHASKQGRRGPTFQVLRSFSNLISKIRILSFDIELSFDPKSIYSFDPFDSVALILMQISRDGKEEQLGIKVISSRIRVEGRQVTTEGGHGAKRGGNTMERIHSVIWARDTP